MTDASDGNLQWRYYYPRLTLNSSALTLLWWCDDVFQMAFTQPVCFMWCLRTSWLPLLFDRCQTHVCNVTNSKAAAGARCVSRASSAKWNCHQTAPEVPENLVLFRKHGRLYFCQAEGATVRTVIWISWYAFPQSRKWNYHNWPSSYSKRPLWDIWPSTDRGVMQAYSTEHTNTQTHTNLMAWNVIDHKGKGKRKIIVTLYDLLW